MGFLVLPTSSWTTAQLFSVGYFTPFTLSMTEQTALSFSALMILEDF